MKLITESNFDLKFQLNEDNKTLFIEGIFATADKQNKNGRVYPKNILEREIKNILPTVYEKTLLGELNHPLDRSEVDLSKSAIMIESLEWRDDDVFGKAKILSTPKGNIVRNLINDGVKLGISSRALGSVNEGIVNEDLELLTWDIVQNPSNHGSWVNGILEGVNFNTKISDDKKLKEEIEKTNIMNLELAKDIHFKQIWQVLKDIG